MAASASLLDQEHSAKVVEIWEALKSEFGLEGVFISPAPHFSYQTARDFDLEMLERVVGDVAGNARPLKVQTAGLAMFTGERPTLYLPVVRTPELTKLQLALWSAGAMATDKPSPEYHPGRWMPHITLAQGDLTPELLPQVVAHLNRGELAWQMDIDNLAIVRGKGDKPQEILARFPLQGGAARNF